MMFVHYFILEKDPNHIFSNIPFQDDKMKKTLMSYAEELNKDLTVLHGFRGASKCAIFLVVLIDFLYSVFRF